MPHIIFSHGKESGPWGGKIRALAERSVFLGATLDSLDYQACADPDQRGEMLLSHIRERSETEQSSLILVGSSMGAYASLVAAQSIPVIGLFLLAPAIGLPEYQQPWIAPRAPLVSILHGWHDNLIPPATVLQWAHRHCCELSLVNDGHRLLQSRQSMLWQFEGFYRRVVANTAERPTDPDDFASGT